MSAPAPGEAISATRRRTMRAVKSRDTQPEMLVRRMVHAMGHRYRLHRADLPGRPDLAFGPRRKAIFVHGCFWHQHEAAGCRGNRMPKARAVYWSAKLARNRERDAQAQTELRRLGWDVLVLWECSLTDRERTASVLAAFLGRREDG